MADEGRDMVLPDSYYKAKRTSLIYSAVLIFLYFGEPSSGAAAPWLDIRVPVRAAALLVWIAAIYYAGIFFWEWRLAKRLNSTLMEGGTFKLVDTRLAQIVGNLDEFQSAIIHRSKLLQEVMDVAIKRGETFPPTNYDTQIQQALANMRYELSDLDKGPLEGRLEKILERVIPNSFRHHAEKLEELISVRERLGEEVGKTQRTLLENKRRVARLQSSFDAMSRDVRIERRLLFYGFDILPVGALLFLASVSMLSITLQIGLPSS